MIIGIDGNEANVINRVGSNAYAYEILKHIYKINRNIKVEVYLKQKPLSDLPKETEWWQYKVLKPRFLWTQWRLPWELYFGKDRPDVFFTPGHYAPRFCPMPLVISIMDLAFLRYPEQFKKNDLYQLINWTKYSVAKARHIFTISEFSKKEIRHFYNIPGNKITVTYPGKEDLRFPTQGWSASGGKIKDLRLIFQKFHKEYGLQPNCYFLYIGTLQPRKNLIELIKAYKILISQFPDIKLVICGKKGWLYDEIFAKVKELGLEDKIIFTGFVNEEEKTELLKNALAFVLPSLYEGFGIPVLEAMQAGCPVIVSRNSSLTEIVQVNDFYIESPFSSLEISQVMLKMLKLDSSIRKQLIADNIKKTQKFSWEKSALKTLEILQQNVLL